MKKILLVATALVAGMTLGLEAQDGDKKSKGGRGKGDPAKRVEMMLEKLDTDKNGSISKAEFAASPMAGKVKGKGGENSIDKLFAARDKNSDGELTKKELAAPRAGGKGGPSGKKPEGKKKKDADS
ncbi:MAG: hypothetical protein CMO61_01470 [Verrucomicrobiales bacterium]|jgi:hypothetical protein|nr:hypothetical protein [Verrucomicrobiales bacterium]|tara:strand:+ start:46013 stop:46390 length:378 start_codon:yes stop_codon:yes gene_type:complete